MTRLLDTHGIMGVALIGRGARRLAISLLLVVTASATVFWLLFPWGPIKGLVVEQASRVEAPSIGSSTTGRPRSAIVVTFSTPTALEAILQRKGAGFINATLSECRSGKRYGREVAAQRAGYLPDDGRVRRLPAARDGRSRYGVTFDDGAIWNDGASSGSGGLPSLCFSLDGGSMWAGKLWSDHIPLAIALEPISRGERREAVEKTGITTHRRSIYSNPA